MSGTGLHRQGTGYRTKNFNCKRFDPVQLGLDSDLEELG